MNARIPVAAIVAAALLFGFLLMAEVMRDFRSFVREPLAIGPEGTGLALAPGTSYRDMVRQLAAQGFTRDSWRWRLLTVDNDLAERIQAGEYWLEPGTTPPMLLDFLVNGAVQMHSFTIVEGWTFAQMRDAIAQSDLFSHIASDLSDQELMSELGRPGEHPEGRFLPETYHLPRGTTDLAFMERSMTAMAVVLEEAWSARDTGLPYDGPGDVLIMASIIEKETANPDERSRIAGVFVRRLHKHMRLQTDPTVIYGLGSGFDGDIRSADLKNDTPYNTYTRHGLPPTPIALPGIDALEAAVHPAEGIVLYFVATGDGQHVFAETLEEHNGNVARYQKKGSK